MKTSVVMATYNGYNYLPVQLDSLRQQTRSIDEVTIYDDRSVDGTVDLVKDYINRYSLKNWSLKVNSIKKSGNVISLMVLVWHMEILFFHVIRMIIGEWTKLNICRELWRAILKLMCLLVDIVCGRLKT